MIHHYVYWNFLEDMNDDQKKEAGQIIKKSLETLKESIPGILELHVVINEKESSNRDIALLSVFENEEALAFYQEHPEHKKAAVYLKQVTCNRVCFDY